MGETRVCSVSIEGVKTTDALIDTVRGVTHAGYAICGIGIRRPNATAVQLTLLTPPHVSFAEVVQRLTHMGISAG